MRMGVVMREGKRGSVTRKSVMGSIFFACVYAYGMVDRMLQHRSIGGGDDYVRVGVYWP